MGSPCSALKARKAGRASEWSPPRVISLGYLKYGAGEDDEDGVRLRSSVYPAVI